MVPFHWHSLNVMFRAGAEYVGLGLLKTHEKDGTSEPMMVFMSAMVTGLCRILVASHSRPYAHRGQHNLRSVRPFVANTCQLAPHRQCPDAMPHAPTPVSNLHNPHRRHRSSAPLALQRRAVDKTSHGQHRCFQDPLAPCQPTCIPKHSPPPACCPLPNPDPNPQTVLTLSSVLPPSSPRAHCMEVGGSTQSGGAADQLPLSQVCSAP